MFKEAYSLIRDYKEPSENFIEKAFDIFISAENLDDFVRDFKIDTQIDSLGEYYSEDRIIKINPDLIESTPISSYKKTLQTMHVIRHEIEHAKNLKKLCEGNHDIESVVLKYSLFEYIKRHKLPINVMMGEESDKYLVFKKTQNYEIDPGERIAEIRASKFMVNLLKNQRHSKDLLIARTLLYYAYIRGYKDNKYYLDAPTYSYLMNMGMFRELYLLKKLVYDTDYSLESRTLYGLPLTYQEKDDILLKKARLQRRVN